MTDEQPGQVPPPQPNWGNAYPPPPQPGHGQPQYYAPIPPKHPQATTAMILGILGLVACGVLAPFAWYIGAKAVREIDASGGAYSGRSEANAGKIMGIIESCLLVLVLIALVGFLVIGLTVASTSNSDF